MTSHQIDRKLAAIMFTDIVGFTSLASNNEQYAIDLLQKQRELLFPIIKTYNGTVHKELGDGLLISFNLTSESVKCAIDIQKSIIDIEDLNLRIGIHEGEIAIGGNDVLGDDVNVASRIEPFSAVGGVSISGRVQQNISSNPDFKTKFIAKPNLKGVNQEINIFAVISENLPLPNIADINAKLDRGGKLKKEILFSTTFGILLFLSFFYLFDFGSDSKQAGFAKVKQKQDIFSKEQQNIIIEIDSLLLKNNIGSTELAFDLASELEFSDTSSIDYKLITAKTILKLAHLNNNNSGFLEKAQNIASKIKDLEFKNFRNYAFCYYILSRYEYFLGQKKLALDYIKKSYFISNSNPEIKQFWKKLNREQLQKWRSSN